MSAAAVSKTSDGETTPVSNELIVCKSNDAVMLDLNECLWLYLTETLAALSDGTRRIWARWPMAARQAQTSLHIQSEGRFEEK